MWRYCQITQYQQISKLTIRLNLSKALPQLPLSIKELRLEKFCTDSIDLLDCVPQKIEKLSLSIDKIYKRYDLLFSKLKDYRLKILELSWSGSEDVDVFGFLKRNTQIYEQINLNFFTIHQNTDIDDFRFVMKKQLNHDSKLKHILIQKLEFQEFIKAMSNYCEILYLHTSSRVAFQRKEIESLSEHL